mgnify:CR=1 FL=1
MAEHRNELSGLLAGLAIGTVIGTVVGILIAPAPGEETRKRLKGVMEEIPDRTRKATEKVKDLIHRKRCEGRDEEEEEEAEG